MIRHLIWQLYSIIQDRLAKDTRHKGELKKPIKENIPKKNVYYNFQREFIYMNLWFQISFIQNHRYF